MRKENLPKINHEQTEDTKAIILKTAQQLFAEKGFKATTAREIARISGANISMIYYYFNSKEELHQQIIEESFNALYLLLKNGIGQDSDPKENIHRVIKIFVTFFHQNRTLHRIILREIVARSKHIDLITQKYISQNFKLINGVIEEGIKKGHFREQNTALATFSLIGMIIHFFNAEQVLKQMYPTNDEITEYLPNHILNLFMYGITANTASKLIKG